ncbi:MAG: nuclear transport factor 2 family protein, partial [Candidatus Eremiobacteraeota bacterium]|nr:nuclear transport factor 2 family protein [Candidatus Eremiobacteraeota bacterium]
MRHNKIAQEILADDFQGTSPEGKRYTKQNAVASAQDTSNTARDCRLLDAKVRFFGESLAMVYGSESSVAKAKDGAEKSRCLIWTDTWLKRNGKWQIIAAQDTQ